MGGTRAKSSLNGMLCRLPALKAVLALVAVAVTAPLFVGFLLAPSALAWNDRDNDRIRAMQREAERIMKEAQRKAREMAKQAEQARKEAERQREEAARAAQQAAKAAQKAAQQAAQKAAQQAAQQAAAQQAAQKAAQKATQQTQQPTKADTRDWTDSSTTKNTATNRQNNKSEDRDDDDRKVAKKDDRDDDDDKRDDVGRADDIIDTPPRTVVEMFNRWTASNGREKDIGDRQPLRTDTEKIRDNVKDIGDAATETVTSSPPAKVIKTVVADDDKGDDADTQSRSDTTTPNLIGQRKPGGRPVASSGNATRHEFELPSLGGRELLAANVNKASLDKLVSLGFKSRGESAVGLLNTSVTRLVPPAGMTASAAKALLHEQIPQQEIMQNRVYRPYRAAANIGGPGAVLPASSTPCSSERCYGTLAVHWSDAHRSCGRSVKVGIIDTHIDLHHPTFEGRRISVGTFLSGASPTVKAAHGTGVLALLAGRPDSGTPGLIPDASFYAADVFFADPSGNAMTDTMSMLKALDWLDASGVRIINMSVSGPPDDLVAKAITALSSRGVIITAAAGNGGPAATASYPAAYPEVISITAVDRKNNAYRQANHGGYIDLAAPGVGVWTAYPDATEGPQTGTSFAVPFATAAIAAVYDNAKPRSKADVLNLLRVSDLGVPGRDTVFGRGLLQAPASNCRPSVPLGDDAPATASLPKKPPATTALREAEVLPWAVPATGAVSPAALGFAE